jgi:hypothetical protein
MWVFVVGFMWFTGVFSVVLMRFAGAFFGVLRGSRDVDANGGFVEMGT